MLKLFIALFGLILVYWIYKKKKQLFVRHPQVEPVITTLEAYELQAFLDATTPLVCLEADGQKFGKQFKEKKLYIACIDYDYSSGAQKFLKIFHYELKNEAKGNWKMIFITETNYFGIGNFSTLKLINEFH